jgi:hypothetical protein
MRVTCDECGNDTYYINFEPPLRGFAECTECGAEQEIGGADKPDRDRV